LTEQGQQCCNPDRHAAVHRRSIESQNAKLAPQMFAALIPNNAAKGTTALELISLVDHARYGSHVISKMV
jgi:hypothetical protein